MAWHHDGGFALGKKIFFTSILLISYDIIQLTHLRGGWGGGGGSDFQKEGCLHDCCGCNLYLHLSLPPQPYRHVDNVMFEDGAIVDRFIEGWRRSGEQRFGYLIGRYIEFTDVPLGIRAVVSAIYEPPQVRHTYSTH